jgi:hypothetical protein
MTSDIYRDVFMFIIFLLSLLIYKKILRSGFFIGIFYFFIYLSLAFFLSLLRPYLGFALAVTPFIYLIFSKTKKYPLTNRKQMIGHLISCGLKVD